ncbi:septum formation family protein [Serinibacter arcticus]|uniref:Putative membrane protein n=1 Tax=Serinibacter arcticus TaxID=1655435 RepID=A0A4Z1E104_9MICO|nr:septum formation family protein [Serinibacter arcticus]TGO05526.1 putative membrane protein [Serinibacter arcticus]
MAKEPPGGREVPEVPAIPTANGGQDAPPPSGWQPGSARSPYAAPPRVERAPQPAPVVPPRPGTGGAPSPSAGPSFAMPQMARAPLDGVSVASVVAGALGTGPIALALGLIGLRRTTRSYRRSPRIAATGVVLGSIGTIALVVVGIVAGLGGFAGGGGTSEPGDVAAPRVVHSSLVAPGNCVQFLPAQQEVGEVTLVPCATEHVAQALTTREVDDATYPGPEGALEAAAAACEDELATRGLDDPAYLPWSFVPTPQGWDAGERTATCLVRSAGAPLTVDLLG